MRVCGSIVTKRTTTGFVGAVTALSGKEGVPFPWEISEVGLDVGFRLPRPAPIRSDSSAHAEERAVSRPRRRGKQVREIMGVTEPER
ncbi:hypothetical protein D3C87_2031120 [compost metagenome]